MLSLPRVALLGAVALAAVPTLAYEDARVARSVATSVVSDATAYVRAVASDPTLTLLNGYQATALTVTHRHVTGVTLEVAATKTAGAARFSLTPASGALSAGDALAIQVKDNDVVHLPVTDTVTIRVDVVVKQGTSSVGAATYSRSVTVTV